jgi:antirestriction protein ArdC
MSADRKEMYAKVTTALIEMMAQGVAPWSKPWACTGVNDVNAPHNGATGRYYRGFNRMYLGLVMFENGWNDPRFMTYKQAKEQGAQVRKGEKGTPVVFNSPIEKKDKATGEVTGKFWLVKQFTVFNVAQIDGLDLAAIEQPTFEGFDEHDDAQHLADGWFDAESIPLGHGGDRAYYSPKLDKVQMPERTDFATPEHYYQTLFHEMIHSSGHERRLKRLDHATFGDDNYAKEELVAEIGAAMLYATAGLDRDLMEHSAAYLKAWASKLEDDPGLLVTAANAAERAAEYVMERVPERV